MNRVAALLLLTLPQSAFAWEHLGFGWDQDNALPLPYQISEVQEDSLDNVDTPDGYTSYEEYGIERGFAAWWEDAPCSGLGATFSGFTSLDKTWDLSDNRNLFTYDDPGDDNNVGVLAATLCGRDGSIGNILGQNYKEAYDCDIVYNDNVDFTSDAKIELSDCDGEHSYQAVTTHEIGHLWGLDHSCEDPDKGGGPCFDDKLIAATMNWTGPSCSSDQSELAADDIESIYALYGPFAEVKCSDTFGVVGESGFDIRCIIDSEENYSDLTGATWTWGDGTEDSTGLTAEHNYAQAGVYSLNIDITGESDECGEWGYQYGMNNAILVCDVPVAGFTVEHEEAYTYKLLNETDISEYNCIYDVQWDIFDSSDALVDSIGAWEPSYAFEEAGEYRIVLNVGGPAGTGAAELTLDVQGNPSTCNSTGQSVGWFGLITLLAVGRRRRQ